MHSGDCAHSADRAELQPAEMLQSVKTLSIPAWINAVSHPFLHKGHMIWIPEQERMGNHSTTHKWHDTLLLYHTDSQQMQGIIDFGCLLTLRRHALDRRDSASGQIAFWPRSMAGYEEFLSFDWSDERWRTYLNGLYPPPSQARARQMS